MELRELIPETEAALTAAKTIAQAEREKALDPVKSLRQRRAVSVDRRV
jgi:hypothetical protein